MAKIVDYREVPLGDLVIGKGQVRTGGPGKDIDKLIESIDKQGLLQPILVCEATEAGKWEILLGQRRYLAHKMLKRAGITAGILDEKVDQAEAKAISITENLIRRNLSGPELIDGITFLYNQYGGNAKAVSEKTGISYDDVRHYVKYPRLVPALKKMVDDGEVKIAVAVRAQDAVEVGDEPPSEEDAVKLALEMKSMPDVQRKKLVKERQDSPEETVDDSIEQARTGSKIIQVNVTLNAVAHVALQQFAKEEESTQDEAAAELIEEALTGRGFLE